MFTQSGLIKVINYVNKENILNENIKLLPFVKYDTNIIQPKFCSFITMITFPPVELYVFHFQLMHSFLPTPCLSIIKNGQSLSVKYSSFSESLLKFPLKVFSKY